MTTPAPKLYEKLRKEEEARVANLKKADHEVQRETYAQYVCECCGGTFHYLLVPPRFHGSLILCIDCYKNQGGGTNG